MAYKTPGVYVEEISLLPPSVAQVETAIPAFIGYTEQATRNGQSLTHEPTRISSLLEYRELFGGPPEHDTISVTVDPDNNYAVESVDFSNEQRYYTYDSVRLFFDNGGGDCYICSVGAYGSMSDADFQTGIDAVKKVDEPTILLMPDATLLADDNQFYSLQQRLLRQCGTLKDRVAVLDLLRYEPDSDADEMTKVAAFRDAIGINNLKYGAAYFPWLVTTYGAEVDFAKFRDNVDDESSASVALESVTADATLNGYVIEASAAVDDATTLATELDSFRGASFDTFEDEYKDVIADLRSAIAASSVDASALNTVLDALRTLVEDLSGLADTFDPDGELHKALAAFNRDQLAPLAQELIGLEKNDDVQSVTGEADGDVNTDWSFVDTASWFTDDSGSQLTAGDISAAPADLLPNVPDPDVTNETVARAVIPRTDAVFGRSSGPSLLSFIEGAHEAAETRKEQTQQLLYQQHPIVASIVREIKREMATLPPSGAMAGVYARVDRTRGVHKAPANVSVSSVVGPTLALDDADQEALNVDVNAGKSVNAIRAFSGRGTVVWGARTLAGNDNEWRYVPVRRFYNTAEESIKKSTAWAVFEPNDASLWTKVRGMIVNYLIAKWKEGALAGPTPEQAFFVNVGLGQTMTQQDILEGRMIVEIGMAVVRPAEFILLRFSHKMQEA